MSGRSTFKNLRRPTTISYLAGLLEGEGTFLRPPPSRPGQPGVVLAMTDEDVVARYAQLVESTVGFVARRRPHHKDVHVCRVRGSRAVELMAALLPHLGSRRRQQVENALAERIPRGKRRAFATEVAEMVALKARGVGRRELAERYGICPKAVDAILRGDVRSPLQLQDQAEVIARAESELERMADGDTNLAWLAGLLEGEGSFSRRAIKLQMTDRDVVERAARLLGGHVSLEPPRSSHWSPTYRTAVSGKRARALSARLRPMLGRRRREQVDRMIAPYVDTVRPVGIPAARFQRNVEIAERLTAGESGVALAREFGVTHQNIYYIKKHYRAVIAFPSG